MRTTQDLQSHAAVEKIQQLITAANICLFATQLTKAPVSVRPMSTSTVDDQGYIWFFSRNDSDKNLHIQADGQVQLLYSNNSSSEYLSIYGYAEIVRDRNKIAELWTALAKAWFTEGKDDFFDQDRRKCRYR